MNLAKQVEIEVLSSMLDEVIEVAGAEKLKVVIDALTAKIKTNQVFFLFRGGDGKLSSVSTTLDNVNIADSEKATRTDLSPYEDIITQKIKDISIEPTDKTQGLIDVK